MKITSLELQDFRCFKSASFQFDQVTLLVGKNGIGKTSVIEAIELLSNGESFRAVKVEDMILMGKELGKVKAKVENEDEEVDLEVMITRGLVQGKRAPRRLFSLNGVRKPRKTFLGNFFGVFFRPEDMRLIEGSPSRRRGYINDVLCLVNRQYQTSLQSYEQSLARRNRLLAQVRDGEQPRQSLSYWNMMMLKHGEVLQNARRELFQFLKSVDFPFPLSVNYVPSVISQDRQVEYLEREILSGHSLIGPHKDDFETTFSGEILTSLTENNERVEYHRLSDYGSRGQQRLGVLWLKLGQLKYVEFITAQTPVLLLDDIFSELDEISRGMVIGLLEKYQTIVTSANEELVTDLKKEVKGLRVEKLNAG